MSGQPAQGDDRLIFGKYKTMEEAEKGFENLVGELNRRGNVASEMQAELNATRQQNAQLAEIAQQLANAQPQGSMAPAPQLVDDEGNLDVHAFLGQVDNQLNDIRSSVNQTVQDAVQAALNPLVAGQQEKFRFQQDNPDFTDAEMQQVLARNPGIAKVFNTLVSNPETARDAYQTVYELAKANRASAPQQPDPQRVQQKVDAGSPEPMGGRPAPAIPEGQQDVEQLSQAAQRAQDIMDPMAQVAFAREFIKGSKLDKLVNDKPDWAEEERNY